MKIGVFTSGGDSPGMNAAIRAVVRTAAKSNIAVYGIYRGYQGMIEDEISELKTEHVANIIQRGGTVLKTSRSEEFRMQKGREKAYNNLCKHQIDALVAIGGNGTYTGADILYKEFGIPTIGLPGTIDNDLLGTDFTIGYDTALNNAVKAIDMIRDTAASHNRVFFVEVMGRDLGFLALQAGIAAGAEAILIPEVLQDEDELIKHFQKKRSRTKAFSIIIIAEGNTEGNTLTMANKVKQQFPKLDIKVSILGHIQRGGMPTANDRILASVLGFHAVEALRNSKHNGALGLIQNKVVFTPFAEAINAHKKTDTDWWNLANILSL